MTQAKPFRAQAFWGSSLGPNFSEAELKELGWWSKPNKMQDFAEYFVAEDVLRERAENEKEIARLKEALRKCLP